MRYQNWMLNYKKSYSKFIIKKFFLVFLFVVKVKGKIEEINICCKIRGQRHVEKSNWDGLTSVFIFIIITINITIINNKK